MIVYAFLPDAALLTGTLKVELYPVGPGTIANGAGGDTLNAVVGQPGWYTATVAEALTGPHRAVLTLDGTPIDERRVDLDDSPAILGVAAAGLVTGFSADAEQDLAAIVQSAVGGVSGSVLAPAVRAGQALELIAGDDYLDAIGRAIPWSLTDAAALPTFGAGWTVALHIMGDLSPSAVIFPGVISQGTGATRNGQVTAGAAITRSLRPGPGRYQLSFTDPAGRTMVLLQGLTRIESRAD